MKGITRTAKPPKAVPISENWEALFDEAIMTPRWKNLTRLYDCTFLPVADDVLARLDRDGCARYVVTDVTKDGTLTLLFDDWTGEYILSPTNVAFYGENLDRLALASLCGTRINSIALGQRGGAINYPEIERESV